MLSIGQKRPEKLRRGDRLAALLWGGAGRVFSFLGAHFTFWFFRRFLLRLYKRSSNAWMISQNIEKAYPDWTDAQRKELLGQVLEAVPLAMAELMLQNYWRRHSEKVTQHNFEVPWLQPYLRNEKPAVFVFGHFAGWEPCVMTLSRYLSNVVGIYAPPKNPLLEPYFRERRVVFPASWTLLPRDLKGLQSRLLEEMKRGTSLVYVLDAPLPGPMLPFLGRTSPTTLTPYARAAELGIPIIPIQCARAEEGIGYTIDVKEPMFAKGSSHEDVVALATAMNDHYSDWIRARPHQWYWTGQFFMPNRIWQAREEARAERQEARGEGKGGP